MMKNQYSYCVARLLTGLVLISMMGCGGGNDSDSMIAELNSNNAKRLGNLYAFFQMKNEWQGPRDEAEFKTFIKSQSAARLERAGVDINQVDELFISERDNMPFKIRWEMEGRVRGPSIPVIFEEEGTEGKRQVGFTGSPMQEVDASEYDRLWKSDPDSYLDAQDDRGDRK